LCKYVDSIFPVEVGFNEFYEICKIGLVFKLPTSRYLFLCIGMDLGLKTFYITHNFKDRQFYKSNGPKYWNYKEYTNIFYSI
jgi:hypothetical protein